MTAEAARCHQFPVDAPSDVVLVSAVRREIVEPGSHSDVPSGSNRDSARPARATLAAPLMLVAPATSTVDQNSDECRLLRQVQYLQLLPSISNTRTIGTRDR